MPWELTLFSSSTQTICLLPEEDKKWIDILNTHVDNWLEESGMKTFRPMTFSLRSKNDDGSYVMMKRWTERYVYEEGFIPTRDMLIQKIQDGVNNFGSIEQS